MLVKELQNNILEENAIFIDGMIGQTYDSRMLRKDLERIWFNTYSEVIVYINSLGGDHQEALSMYHILKNSPLKVITCNIGLAFSSAMTILQAGDTRKSLNYAYGMIHNLSSVDSEGNTAQNSDTIKASYGQVAEILSAKANISKDEIFEIMSTEKWLNAEEMKKIGLIDMVIETDNIEMATKVLENKTDLKKSYALMNSLIIKKPKKKVMEKVTNHLGLVVDANEESILGAIINKQEALKNAYQAEKVKVSDMAAEAKKRNEENASLKNELEVFKASELEKITNEAKEYVSTQVTLGKLPKDEKTVDFWVSNYITNKEVVKSQLSSFVGVSPSKPVIEVSNSDAKEVKKITTAERMSKLRLK